MVMFMTRFYCQASTILRSPWLIQVRFMCIPRIRLKPDRALDEVTERDKILRPFFRIADVVRHQESHAIKMRRLEQIKWQFGIKNKKLTLAGFMKRYPNIFIVFANPDDGKLWCKFTSSFTDLLDEEDKICDEMESHNVLVLRRLLMMTAAGRIQGDNLQAVRRIFGFPADLLDRLVPQYPHYFKLVEMETSRYVELVDWDEGLALSEFEKKAKQEALDKGMGDIEVRGKPFPFKIILSPGMALRKKNLQVLESWQKLPYISPYEDWTLVKKGTPLSEKRLVGLMHEFLSLTVEKKARLKVIMPFRSEFGLSQKINHLFERFPGIFYTSLRGGIKTIMLREAYVGSDPIQDHPLVQLKKKFIEIVNAGPHLPRAKKMDQNVHEVSVTEVGDADFSEGWSENDDEEETSEAEVTNKMETGCNDMYEDHISSNESEAEVSDFSEGFSGSADNDKAICEAEVAKKMETGCNEMCD
ncbi:hypothetical protein KP509_24G018700 [Ceratopteris richardii]|uniref:PORR domain-containing protein n=1 Tax=Ceratopteris richardii TaxID=49495 RepID=A0A8T2RV00_CERRI|nr:hypothetical protein KP509_24G018700 [Ceratopteris richardii]